MTGNSQQKSADTDNSGKIAMVNGLSFPNKAVRRRSYSELFPFKNFSHDMYYVSAPNPVILILSGSQNEIQWSKISFCQKDLKSKRIRSDILLQKEDPMN